MKRIIALLILGIYTHSFSITIPGSVIGEKLNTDDIIRYRLPFVSDSASYVNGGLTFTYPFTFIGTPRISIGIQLPFATPFIGTIAYAAIIESISNTSVTIRVTKTEYDGATLTTVSEAASNEVIVTIWAVENPF